MWTGKYTLKDVLLKQLEEENKRNLAQSSVLDGMIAGAKIGIIAMGKQANKYISNAVRPNNIGAGLFAKQQASQLSKIEIITDKATKSLKTLGKIASVGAVVADVGVGIYDNIQNNESAGKIAYDAVVDTSFTVGNIFISGAIGAAAGSVVPGVGTIVGFAVGVLTSIVTDVWVGSNGKTMRETVKGFWQ